MAKHILKYTEWECNGIWYCNDVASLCKPGALWYTPARAMNMPLVDFVELIIVKFKADKVKWFDDRGQGFFLYGWTNQADMRKFKNWLNAEMRKHNVLVD